MSVNISINKRAKKRYKIMRKNTRLFQSKLFFFNTINSTNSLYFKNSFVFWPSKKKAFKSFVANSLPHFDQKWKVLP